ncbi:aminotransferase class IV [Sphingomonas sp. LB-2]|uniref:aminotransferase class IV n=1 Tax=Sphingomonas caeni TaxID=2984949 RepID=UPI0022318B75|nr:aminotransferase class IV [Sphingomonas caeni]MCW3845932.1 aminotransferase class IV [Sphingomonas caeni]
MGDGVWEGLRLHNRALLFLDAHLDRLYAGAAAIRIDIGLSRAGMVAALKDLLEANSMTDGAHLRLMVTRGRKASINQDPRNALGAATIAITAEYKTSVPGPGLALRSVPTRTTGPEMFDMRLNSHSRLPLIRALLEAIDLGGDEALMLDPHGNIASCNATNFFWVKGGRVFTSGDTYCFNGITRGNIIAAVPVEQGDFPLGHLADAEEAFVTGTMGGVTPVREIDGRALPGGLVTARIAAAYAAMKNADAAANPLW